MNYNFPNVHKASKIGRAYEIIDSLSGGKPSDDNQYSVRLIMRSIETAYAKLLKDDLKQRQDTGDGINDSLYVSFTCQTLIKDENCSCNGNCELVYVSIPTLAQWQGKPLIRNVRTGNISFTPATDFNAAKSIASSSNIFVKQNPAYYVSGSRIFLVLPARFKRLESICFEAITETYDTSTNGCEDIWAEFPMQEHLWEATKVLVRGREGNALLTTSPNRDIIND